MSAQMRLLLGYLTDRFTKLINNGEIVDPI